MKHALLVLILTPWIIVAAESPTTPSKVEEVTFFISGAQVKRVAPISFLEGVSEIVLNDLEPNINAGSLILAGQGAFTLLSYRVESRVIQPKQTQLTDPMARKLLGSIEAVKDSIEELVYMKSDIDFRREVINNEKRLLINNPINQGTSIGDSLQLLQGAVSYLRERLNEVNKLLIGLDRETKELSLKQARLNQRYQALQQEYNAEFPTKSAYYDWRLVLTVEAETAGKGKVDFSYLVNQAGWSPEIEFKSQGVGSPMIIQQRAQIYQNTGKDWDEVKLFVSTSNPNTSKAKPFLQPWVVQLVDQNRTSPVMMDALQVYEESNEITPRSAEATGLVKMNVSAVTSTDQLAHKRYEFDRLYSIKGNGGYPIRVNLERAELACDYRLVAVPKLDDRVFVMARFGDWKSFMLPNPTARLYYENTYLGELNLNNQYYADTLELSMGVDDGLRVRRELVIEKSKSKLIGSRKTQERTFCYTVENFKNEPVTVFIQDHLPLSRQDELKIERLECKEGDYDVINGTIEWQFDVLAKGKRKFECGFKISYPKEKTFTGL